MPDIRLLALVVVAGMALLVPSVVTDAGLMVLTGGGGLVDRRCGRLVEMSASACWRG